MEDCKLPLLAHASYALKERRENADRKRCVMSMNNPLADDAPTDHKDQALVMLARAGDREALEHLIERHQGWIYNIAVRMLYHPQDAEDATQEILVKVLTRLSSFEGRSSFRTWLYRVVFNHLLNVKRGREELKITTFSAYGDALDNTPDLELPDLKGASPDTNLLVTEVMLACTSGMLLCLDREQRLTYILGAIFGVSDAVGADLLEITAENFRQRLTRARRDLRNFMNDKCGLINKSNPCRCAKKTRGFIREGHVDPDNLLFSRGRISEVREVAPKVFETIKTLDDKCAEIYRQHQFYKPPDLRQVLRQLIQSAT
jgi:RNA polymerase sigma factor (sigma-70 family)